MLSYNVRSLINQTQELICANFISANSYDLLCLCETRLDESFKDGGPFLHEYNLIRCERQPGQRGGVLAGVSSSVQFDILFFSKHLGGALPLSMF